MSREDKTILGRAEFVERWKATVAGHMLFGFVGNEREAPSVRAARVWNIPAETEKLLTEMYNGLGVYEYLLNKQATPTCAEAVEYLKALPEDVKRAILGWIEEQKKAQPTVNGQKPLQPAREVKK